MSKKKKGADHATPALTGPTETPEEMVATTKTHCNALEKSPEWPKAPGVQTTQAAWKAAGEDLDANITLRAGLKKQLAAAEADGLVLMRRCHVKARGCLNAVDDYCDGSVDTVQAMSFAVIKHAPRPAATMPQNVRPAKGRRTGVAIALWDCDKRPHDYHVQYATNPTDPSTYSPILTVSRRCFKLTGQPPGSTLHVRVLTIDSKLPLGQTDWTPWTAIPVGN